MNRFKQNLTSTADGLKEARAEQVSKQAEYKFKAIVDKKKDEVLSLEIEASNLTDLGPETTDSLRPVSPNFNAANWANAVTSNALRLEQAKIELKIIENKYEELFGELPSSPTA